MGELRHAIDRDQLLLLYQPKIDLKTTRVVGVEALVRWRHPERGMVPPDQFIPVAERSGLIRPLTLWVLDAALAQARAWRDAGLELSVAVNLSVRSLHDRDLPHEIARRLSAYQIAPGLLELEITESIIMVDPARAMDVLTQLSQLGVQLSIDDFGTGYSSLGYLKKLPVHQVKIDKSFVLEMERNKDDAVIVRSTIDLAHNLSLKVVAEGVENREIFNRLATQGCDAAQGYYISRPICADEIGRWLTNMPAQDLAFTVNPQQQPKAA
jgi:EAL domain-containing protein (putative c-di-GMP-specific phosphodiesterase class I)